ncbi:hypothetical protein ACFX2J_014560 [Malus domestica]
MSYWPMPLNKVQTGEEKKSDVVEEATEFPLTKWVIEETPAQLEHEKVEHDNRVNEEEVETVTTSSLTGAITIVEPRFQFLIRLLSRPVPGVGGTNNPAPCTRGK